MKIFKKNQNGFTLVELLLYIALASVMLAVVSGFLGTILNARVKNQTIAEVTQQGQRIMSVMTQAIRNAEAINSQATSTSAALLDLDVIEVANDPTIFDLSAGVLRITEGASAAVDMTSSRVVISDLQFDNLSRTDTAGSIKIQFTISHINPAGNNQYEYSKIFYGAASIR